MSNHAKTHGFGSFHTEREEDRIDVLIAQTDDEYKPPNNLPPVFFDSFPLPGYLNLSINIDPSIQTEQHPPATQNPSTGDHTTVLEPCSHDKALLSSAEIPFGRATLKTWFDLDPSFTFINHGAFGAIMRPATRAERYWHHHMEQQPLRFIDRELLPLLVYTTRRLARFVNAPPTDMVLLPNATTGLNTVMNSINWFAQDSQASLSSIFQHNQHEQSTLDTYTLPPIQPAIIITFNTGYGATKQIIKSVQDKYGPFVRHIELELVFPVQSSREVVSLLKHTLRQMQKNGSIHQVKLVIIDYIQSNHALVFPVKELCTLCSSYNIPTLVDAAHALGSMPLNIIDIAPTFLVSNAHKWLCSGKGVSLLYVSPQWHAQIKPSVVSHGYSSQTLAGKFTWVGLQDYAHYLSLITALDAYKMIGERSIYSYISSMIQKIGTFLTTQWNSELLGPTDMFSSMIAIRLPGPRVPRNGSEHTSIQDQLYFDYKIEVPIKMIQNRLYVRVSCHIYNDWNDYVRLSEAMLHIRPKLTPDQDLKDDEDAQTAELVNPDSSCG